MSKIGPSSSSVAAAASPIASPETPSGEAPSEMAAAEFNDEGGGIGSFRNKSALTRDRSGRMWRKEYIPLFSESATRLSTPASSANARACSPCCCRW